MNPRWRRRALLAMRETLFSVVRGLVGAYPCGEPPRGVSQFIFFANHTSHLDTLTVLAALPLRARLRTRPVAARDYWAKTPLRRWVAEQLLNVVFIDRERLSGGDPLAPVYQALDAGSSVVIFPEGTRRETPLPGDFKNGLYHLALKYPQVKLRPVYLENLHRILPKGTFLPVPLINKVHFGPALQRVEGEAKAEFLQRAHRAVCDLCPGH